MMKSGKKWCNVVDCGILLVTQTFYGFSCFSRRRTVFRGVTGINIDLKGRIVMPSRYRERLQHMSDSNIVLTIDTEERCLLLYPLEVWEDIESKLAALPSFNVAARRIQRLLIGHATETEIDGQGRILLPPLLREYAELDKKAVLIGQGKKFELWDENHWQTRRSQWLDEETTTDSGLPDEVKLLSL